MPTGVRLRKYFADRRDVLAESPQSIMPSQYVICASPAAWVRAELFGTYHETLIISNDGVCTANGRYYAGKMVTFLHGTIIWFKGETVTYQIK